MILLKKIEGWSINSFLNISERDKCSDSRSFWGFAEHFKDQADALMNQLDAGKQRSLQGELSLSSSNNSLNNGEKTASAGRVRVRSASQDRGYESSTLGFVLISLWTLNSFHSETFIYETYAQHKLIFVGSRLMIKGKHRTYFCGWLVCVKTGYCRKLLPLFVKHCRETWSSFRLEKSTCLLWWVDLHAGRVKHFNIYNV